MPAQLIKAENGKELLVLKTDPGFTSQFPPAKGTVDTNAEHVSKIANHLGIATCLIMGTVFVASTPDEENRV